MALKWALLGACCGVLLSGALYLFGVQSYVVSLPVSTNKRAGRLLLLPPDMVYRSEFKWKYYRPDAFQQVRYEDPQAGTVFLAPVQAEWLTRHEKHVFAVFDHLHCAPDGSTIFLDVGANDGTYSMLAAKRGCRVVSFELQHQCIELFSGTLGLNGIAADTVTIVQRPVSDVTGRALKLDNTGPCSGIFSVGHVSDKGHLMSTVALESFFSEVSVALLKIDTEGHEPWIIAGFKASSPLGNFSDCFIQGHGRCLKKGTSALPWWSRSGGPRAIHQSSLWPTLSSESLTCMITDMRLPACWTGIPRNI